MDLAWGDEITNQFITNVGLITSNGKYGNNIMACEWTHHVSYSPGLIAVCINPKDATHSNISETMEFGVNLTSIEQNVLTSVSGGNSGKDVDKISALKELGFRFFKAKKINVLMVEDAVVNLECKLFKKIELGDHSMFVGEIVEIYPYKNKTPLVYHGQKYWKLGERLSKPSQEELQKINMIVARHKKR
jgi:flavin reductase (DIM6/NTAB) family NADH-FMN oxidoreductase RutF